MKDKNIDLQEIKKFSDLAASWWDQQGEMKPLHLINPIRTQYVSEKVALKNMTLLDVGCGGGILSESLATLGASVTGIDMSKDGIAIAKEHAKSQSLKINYQVTTAEAFAIKKENNFDIVTCMEVLEHVPNPASLINACAQLTKPGGHIFFSTINRNPKSYLFAILGAEYFLKMLPKGTHDYDKFIRPSELDRWARTALLKPKELKGISYNPISQSFNLTDNVDINYLAYYKKDD